ncbi:DUF3592 domain-containing protein [Streptomyces sp. NPDC059874]|uniref:DUF3592 domain-containing protein n=1 Tax=Streptomyces sp. NPDC059874 TaxID=3346983 RepID=UPI003651485B
MLAVGAANGLSMALLGLMLAVVGAVGVVWLVRSGKENRRIFRDGLVAEARCLETYVMNSRSTDGYLSSRRVLVLGFHTPDGRDVRTEMADIPYAKGDTVPVRYLPERPERVLHAGARPGLDFGSCYKGAVFLGMVCGGLMIVNFGFSGA